MELSVTKSFDFWAPIAAGVFFIIAIPIYFEIFSVIQITQYIILSVYALSLAYIWGYCGIISFGQATFFGLGAYTFAVASLNMGETTIPLILAMALPALFGAALGYFMFYGRLSEVYMGVVTLLVTLIFWKILNHSAGPEYTIGDVQLGGFNGIPSIPVLNVPGFPSEILDPIELFQLFIGILIAIYAGLRLLIASDFGRVSVAIKENETRASLLGYNVPLHKVIVFSVGSGIAGLAGAMWATYQTFIDPNVFSLEMSAKPLIWVLVGGVGSLVGPILGVILLQWLSLKLGALHILNNLVIMGGLMIVLVLVVPQGLVPALRKAAKPALVSWRERKDGTQSGSMLKNG